jgi:branched-chain amino acid transport system ATP-binding protein
MASAAPLLSIKSIHAGYGESQVLDGLSISVGAGEVVCLLGANGVGKTTTLMAITGIVEPTTGDVVFDSQSLLGIAPHQRVELGITLAPEGRQVFQNCSVHENLLLGSFSRRGRKVRASKLDEVYGMFPRLAERRKQMAGLMSGGEQQMLAIGRALMSNPRLLMLDEPSLGLAPKIALQVYEVIARIAASGISILLVEQNTQTALSVAERGYVLSQGRVALSGSNTELLDASAIREAFFGASQTGAQGADAAAPTSTGVAQ